jgi:hypothetical protein
MINRSQRNLGLLFGRSRLTGARTFSNQLVAGNDNQAASPITSLWEFSEKEIAKRESKAQSE